MNMSDFKYFNYSEFDSPDEPGSGKKYMSKEFIEMLSEARSCAGIPFFIVSGYRTRKHNATLKNSVKNSTIMFFSKRYSCFYSTPIDEN